MNEINSFIKCIDIKKIRHLQDIRIEIDDTRPKHLILTGPNGCGKTSLLLALKDYLNGVPSGALLQVENWRKSIKQYEEMIKNHNVLISDPQIADQEKAQRIGEKANFEITINNFNQQLKPFDQVAPKLSSLSQMVEAYKGGSFIIAYFGSKRFTQINPVSGVTRVDLPTASQLEGDLHRNFLQFLVNQENKAGMSFYKNDMHTYDHLAEWKQKFISRLSILFHAPDLRLEYNIDSFDFTINIPGREPFGLNQLSDGFSSAIQIIAELILRMEKSSSGAYDLPGIVMIDEIETHLHIELQKEILPFLCDFFPKIQFIVTSHSPFVLNSLPNSVVYDLESRKRWENLSSLPASLLIEEYFDSNQYSSFAENTLKRLEHLLMKESRSKDEEVEIIDIRANLDVLCFDDAPELVTQYQFLKAKEKKG